MNMTTLEAAIHNREIAAGNLLIHTHSCTGCFVAFAIDGKVGAGCANGKKLRITWVEFSEEVQYHTAADLGFDAPDGGR